MSKESKRYTPDPKYRGDPESFKRLDDAISRAVERNDDMAIEYQTETLQFHVAAWLRAMRVEAGKTQTELADDANVAQSFIARLENPNSSKEATLATLDKVARALGKRVLIQLVDSSK